MEKEKNNPEMSIEQLIAAFDQSFKNTNREMVRDRMQEVMEVFNHFLGEKSTDKKE